MMGLVSETELRFLSAIHRRELALRLDPADGWRELASRILVPGPSGKASFLLSIHHMRSLDQLRFNSVHSPTQALIDLWSTTGRKGQRPKVSDLLSLLIDCRLTRAAKYVAIDILGHEFDDDEGPNAGTGEEWNPCLEFSSVTFDSGSGSHLHVDPSAPVPSILSSSSDLMLHVTPHSGDHASVSGCPTLPYNMLAMAANHFVDDGSSHKIGEGAFGSVFRACLPDGKVVAIKVLKSELLDQQFVNEVSIMRKFRHENLLPLIAVSTDGPSPCLVYKYMARGSVNRFLACSGQDLTSSCRLTIAIGTARGLHYLHTAFDQPFVHRDVKSDNILLDTELTPKVGDFGLTRIGSAGTGMTRSRQFTQNVIGTSAYMAPEAFRGDVSIKLDSFAFGIVLLELLTGLKPYDEEREESDLLALLEERLDNWADENFSGQGISDLLDPNVSDWNLQTAEQLAVVAKRATNQRKKIRPTISQILLSLQPLL